MQLLSRGIEVVPELMQSTCRTRATKRGATKRRMGADIEDEPAQLTKLAEAAKKKGTAKTGAKKGAKKAAAKKNNNACASDVFSKDRRPCRCLKQQIQIRYVGGIIQLSLAWLA